MPMSIIYAKKEGLTLFVLVLIETMVATEEAGGKVQVEPMGIASFLITSEEKRMVEDVWMCCEKCCL